VKEPIDKHESSPVDWSAIVHEHGSLVWRTAYRLLGKRADAEDCYQETFASALKVSGREEVRNWPGLLQRLATARGLEILRVRQRRKRERGEDFPAEMPSPAIAPHRRAESAEIMAALLEAVAELPVAQGQIFCMRFLSEMSYEEIARMMGISVDAVAMSLNRAKASVRVRLRPKYSENQEVKK
jgi:RNA polymerase sigma-70 factor (ECF subfamily)